MDPRHAPLFEPLQIGPVTAPNRFFAVPHAIGHSPLMPNGAIGLRETKAEGGWGVVAMQLAEIDESSDISGLPIETFRDDQDVAIHARLTDRLRAKGALSAIELGHTGLRSRGMGTGMPVLGPSAQRMLKPEFPIHCKAMDKSDIRALRASFRAAVRRSKQAGYDIAYVYAAHDASILWHFLSPYYNRRSDEYGGSFENRLRLYREVLEDAQDEAAGQIAIATRFAVHEAAGRSGITHDGEGRDVVEALAELPDLWDVNISSWPRDSGTSRFDGEGFQEEFTAFVKQVTTKPVVGVGRFTSPDAMVSQLRRGVLDMIGAARPSLADPFLPAKIREGRSDDIRECIGCNVCVSHDVVGVPLRCTQNPTLSEEWRRGWHPELIPPADTTAHSLIVGSGPAGLEAALTLARAGHRVTIAEATPHFGGRAHREAALPGLSAWGRVADYRLYQLRQLGQVSLYAESALDAAAIAEFGADHILLATGATWADDGSGGSRFDPIPGFAGTALTPDTLPETLPDGPVILYDDDHYYMGNLLALQLARQGHQVHLVTPLPYVAAWMNMTLEQPRVVAQLYAAGIHMHPNSTAQAWKNGTLHLCRSDTGTPLPGLQGRSLLVTGSRIPETALSTTLHTHQVPHRLIGDAEAPGTLQAAIYSGHRHARTILNQNPSPKRERPTLLI